MLILLADRFVLEQEVPVLRYAGVAFIVVGIVLVANAANLALMSSGLGRGQSPIHPLAPGPVSDPLVQAMTITAVVIGFGVTALLLSLAYRIYVSSHTVDLDELSHAEALREREQFVNQSLGL